MPDQPTQKSMLDFLRDSYKALEASFKPPPGPTLTVEAVSERGQEEPGPAYRLLDKLNPEAAEKLRQAEPVPQDKETERASRQREERPTELKHEHNPPGTQPAPTMTVGGITFTSKPQPPQPQQPEPRNMLITTYDSMDQRRKEPLPHEALIARVEGRPEQDLTELAEARLAAVRESDKGHERGNRSLSLFADPGKGRRLK